jgi:hypothetical protein
VGPRSLAHRKIRSSVHRTIRGGRKSLVHWKSLIHRMSRGDRKNLAHRTIRADLTSLTHRKIRSTLVHRTSCGDRKSRVHPTSPGRRKSQAGLILILNFRRLRGRVLGPVQVRELGRV